MFAGNFAPRGWAVCDGGLLNINDYNELYVLLGNTYGGDGYQTFGLPDLRDRAPIATGSGSGLAPIVLGQLTGNEEITLSKENLPLHNHTLYALTAAGTVKTPDKNMIAATAATKDVYIAADVKPTPTKVAMSPLSIGPNNGKSMPVSIMQPYLTVNFIIALVGIYPSFQ